MVQNNFASLARKVDEENQPHGNMRDCVSVLINIGKGSHGVHAVRVKVLKSQENIQQESRLCMCTLSCWTRSWDLFTKENQTIQHTTADLFQGITIFALGPSNQLPPRLHAV